MTNDPRGYKAGDVVAKRTVIAGVQRYPNAIREQDRITYMERTGHHDDTRPIYAEIAPWDPPAVREAREAVIEAARTVCVSLMDPDWTPGWSEDSPKAAIERTLTAIRFLDEKRSAYDAARENADG